MKYINIEVKPEDINNATRRSLSSCPVAMALHRKYHIPKNTNRIRVFNFQLVVDNNLYNMSKHLTKLIESYDSGENFPPGTYRAYHLDPDWNDTTLNYLNLNYLNEYE